MIGKPRRLIVSWRCTSAMTRLWRARSSRFRTRSRVASSTFCLITGWIAMKRKTIHQYSLMESLRAAGPAESARLRGPPPSGEALGRGHAGDPGRLDGERPRDGRVRGGLEGIAARVVADEERGGEDIPRPRRLDLPRRRRGDGVTLPVHEEDRPLVGEGQGAERHVLV